MAWAILVAAEDGTLEVLEVFDTRADAEEFGTAEVGVPYMVMQSAD